MVCSNGGEVMKVIVAIAYAKHEWATTGLDPRVIGVYSSEEKAQAGIKKDLDNEKDGAGKPVNEETSMYDREFEERTLDE